MEFDMDMWWVGIMRSPFSLTVLCVGVMLFVLLYLKNLRAIDFAFLF